MVRGASIMYYVYYNDRGNIVSVTTTINASNNFQYLEIDLQTYEDFMTRKKQIYQYKVIKNIKIKGKYHIVATNLDESTGILQPKGIITKHQHEDDALIFNQDLINGTWTVSSTMNSEMCSLFAQGADCIKEYYVVNCTNRYILLDTLTVNLKTVALHDRINLENYNKGVCKQRVSLLCNSHHVKHIHNVQE